MGITSTNTVVRPCRADAEMQSPITTKSIDRVHDQ